MTCLCHGRPGPKQIWSSTCHHHARTLAINASAHIFFPSLSGNLHAHWHQYTANKYLVSWRSPRTTYLTVGAIAHSRLSGCPQACELSPSLKCSNGSAHSTITQRMLQRHVSVVLGVMLRLCDFGRALMMSKRWSGRLHHCMNHQDHRRWYEVLVYLNDNFVFICAYVIFYRLLLHSGFCQSIRHAFLG